MVNLKVNPEPIPWPLLTGFGLFAAYGLWLVLWPSHFRQMCMRHRPKWVNQTLFPDLGTIRILGIAWIILNAFGFFVGLWSKISK